MKKIILSLAIILTINSQAQDIKGCYRIEGMHCGNCKDSIENNLKKINGVKNINISLRDEVGQMNFDPNLTNDKQIISTIKLAGYQAKKIKCSK